MAWSTEGFAVSVRNQQRFGSIASNNTSLYAALNSWTQNWNPVASWGWWSWFGSVMKGLYQSCVDLFGGDNHPKGSNPQGRGGSWGCAAHPSPQHLHISGFCLIPAKPNGAGSPQGFLQCWEGRESLQCWSWQEILCHRGCPWPQSCVPHGGRGWECTECRPWQINPLQCHCSPKCLSPLQEDAKAVGMKIWAGSLECSRHWGTAIDSSS